MPITNGSALTKAERRALLRPPVGTVFDSYEPVFGAYDNGTVFDYGDFDVRDIAAMLRRDGKARSLEQVLTLPIRGADWRLTAGPDDQGQHKLVEDNLGKKLGRIIDQCSTAMGFRRAYFETNWRLDGDKLLYDDVCMRPAPSCEAGFNPTTGEGKGFRQRIAPLPGAMQSFSSKSGAMPGYEIIKADRAFIYTHGSFRDPIKGISDLDVAYWCYETKQKVLFLWFQFLENQSLPKVVTYGDDLDQARELATDVATLKASGVLGLPRPGDPTAKAFEVLESSGAGAGQFYQAIEYLDAMMPASVLAGFTELAMSSQHARGSYALSADQSEFFLASRQAVADEIAESIRADLFGPLVFNNFGPDVEPPLLTIGPLSNRDTERALTLLGQVVAATQLNVPREFVDMLTHAVAGFLGLDADKVQKAIEADVIAREKAKAAMEKAQAAGAMAPPVPGQPPGPGLRAVPKPPPPPAAKALSQAVDVAYELVNRSRSGESPESVLAELAAR